MGKYTSEDLIDLNEEDIAVKVFADENRLITSDLSEVDLAKGYKDILALFSDGTFLVSETHKFDGRVFAFKSLMEKTGNPVDNPIYLGMRLLSSIYQNETRFIQTTSKKSQGNFKNEMQRAYVDIVAKAAKLHVSDIHVVVSKQTSVMFRIDGTMQTVLEYDNNWGESFVRSVFASADISDSNYSQNEFQGAQKLGDTPIQGERDLYLPSNVLAIRLQFNPIAFGSQYLVMRLLYANSNSEDADDLKTGGFTEFEDKKFFELRAAPTGIVIVSGPTGSGKSTTLQRNMIKYLKENNYEVNLITVEDPPEYPIPGAKQMPVTNAENEELKEEAFIKALAASLRSDPDTLMIGEIRTLSAAELAFKGALSGHNVWSTLHANSASAIVLRLMDMGVDAFKLRDPAIIRGLTAQRLFKTICPNCKKRVADHPELSLYARMKEAYGDIGLEQSYIKGDGCEACDYKGITGRTCCSEIIMPDTEFLDYITNNRTDISIKYWINELGGRTLKESAVEKMFQGVVSLEEVERWCGFINRAN